MGMTLQKKGDVDGAAKCFNESFDVQRMMIGEGQDSIKFSDSLNMLGISNSNKETFVKPKHYLSKLS